MTPGENPYRAPEQQEVREPGPVIARPRLTRLLIVVQCAAIIVGLGAALIEVETIMVTGGVLSLTGCALLLLGSWQRRLTVAMFGASGPGISLLCLGLILFMRWSPSQAERPVPRIGAAYAVLALPLGLAAYRACGRRAAE